MCALVHAFLCVCICVPACVCVCVCVCEREREKERERERESVCIIYVCEKKSIDNIINDHMIIMRGN